jgi:hypothetical protein
LTTWPSTRADCAEIPRTQVDKSVLGDVLPSRMMRETLSQHKVFKLVVCVQSSIRVGNVPSRNRRMAKVSGRWGIELLDMQEVPLSMGFNTGIPGK